MRTQNASIEHIEHLMGHQSGPALERRRGDLDRPAILIGITPTVHAYPSESEFGARVTDAIGRVCTFIAFVLYVIVPVLGALNIAFRS